MSDIESARAKLKGLKKGEGLQKGLAFSKSMKK